MIAAAIAVSILVGLVLLIGKDPIPKAVDAAATNPLWSQMITLTIVVVIWFLAGPALARRSPEAS